MQAMDGITVLLAKEGVPLVESPIPLMNRLANQRPKSFGNRPCTCTRKQPGTDPRRSALLG